MSKIQEVAQAVELGKVKLIQGLVQEALDEGNDPQAILNEGMIGAMNVVGAKFQANEIFVPEMLVAAKTMKKGVEVLRPHLAGDSIGANGKFIIGTVAGDLHDIGKNLVRMMMESKGLNVIDLGNSVPPAKYIEAAAKHNADIIACSALLTTTMVHIKDVVKGVAESPLAGKVKIMIGGAPVNDAFRESIGADYYTPDASSAAEKALEICAAARA